MAARTLIQPGRAGRKWPLLIHLHGWDEWYRNPTDNLDALAIDHFLDEVVARGLVDTDRIYVFGWSNGAYMAALYGMWRANRIPWGTMTPRAVNGPGLIRDGIDPMRSSWIEAWDSSGGESQWAREATVDPARSPTGRLKEKVVLWPGVLLAQSWPPCASTSPLQM